MKTIFDEKTELSPTELTDALSTATHESGHFILAHRFNLRPAIEIVSATAGFCHFDNDPDPAVRETICWGGIIAEDLLGVRKASRNLPLTPLSESTLDAYVGEVVAAIRANNASFLSLNDRMQILASRPSRPEQAYTVLAANKEELKAVAETILETYTPTMILARSLDRNALIKARAGRGGNFDAPKLNTAVERLADYDRSYREAAKLAQKAASKAFDMSRDLDRLGAHATPDMHREAVALHHQAALAHLEAKEAAEEHNRQWAAEFEAAFESGDESGMRKAARCLKIHEVWSHGLAARKECEAQVRRKHKAKLWS